MQQPDFYPHPVHGEIRFVQTHISYVFLTGDFAYKVKKHVKLEFLDYSTLDSRRFYCYEELRLNQAFAPDLYLDVVPIAFDGSNYHLGDESGGEVVEYALKMRQFDEDKLLLNLHKRGELNRETILRVAEKLALIHMEAPTDDRIRSYGEPDAVKEIVEENHAIARQFVGTILGETDFQAIENFTRRYFQEHVALLESRGVTGKIRECHGDLHLNNICIYRGDIEFFDRIEFNERFKNIDVMYDLAFLLMDLNHRRRRGDANVLANTYLERTGDYEGAALLPLYLAMRAEIRGNVMAITSQDPDVDDATMRADREESLSYYRQAVSHATPPTPRLVIMSGVSGSGKTTIARALAERLEAFHVRSDAVRKHLAGIALDDHDANIYSAEHTRQTYAELARLSSVILESGQSVILDAKYDRVGVRKDVLRAAKSTGVPLTIVYCSAKEETLMARVDGRTGDISDATRDLIHRQLREFEPFDSEETEYIVEVDTESEIGVEQVLSRIGA